MTSSNQAISESSSELLSESVAESTPESVSESALKPVPASAEPIATVNGKTIINLPKDLYIPPDAMRVFLDAFEGPLDLLLYLIKKQNIDILDIPIAKVSKQYVEYIELMKEISLELAAEYLVMAAMLAEIKSRMLLPRPVDVQNDEEDPRAELVRRLQEYERFKQAAEDINQLPREERDIFTVKIVSNLVGIQKPLPSVSLQDLYQALVEVFDRAKLQCSHRIEMETLSVQEKMTHILSSLQGKDHYLFSQLFNLKEGRLGIIVTFLAMLELLKQSLIEFVQASAFAPIYLKTMAPEDNPSNIE